MTPELDAVLSRSPVWRQLYETNPRYRKAWDEGRGPGQTSPMPPIYGPSYNHWMPLHYYAARHSIDWNPFKAKAFFRKWQSKIPNRGCGCRANWKRLKMKPDFSSAQAFFEWAWRAHNTVNAKLKKPNTTLCEAYATWWPELVNEPHSHVHALLDRW